MERRALAKLRVKSSGCARVPGWLCQGGVGGEAHCGEPQGTVGGSTETVGCRHCSSKLHNCAQVACVPGSSSEPQADRFGRSEASFTLCAPGPIRGAQGTPQVIPKSMFVVSPAVTQKAPPKSGQSSPNYATLDFRRAPGEGLPLHCAGLKIISKL